MWVSVFGCLCDYIKVKPHISRTPDMRSGIFSFSAVLGSANSRQTKVVGPNHHSLVHILWIHYFCGCPSPSLCAFWFDFEGFSPPCISSQFRFTARTEFGEIVALPTIYYNLIKKKKREQHIICVTHSRYSAHSHSYIHTIYDYDYNTTSIRYMMAELWTVGGVHRSLYI